MKFDKKKIIVLIAIIAILIIAIILIKNISKNQQQEEENENILYTHELKYNIYIDENGDYVKEYENGDKTIETRK